MNINSNNKRFILIKNIHKQLTKYDLFLYKYNDDKNTKKKEKILYTLCRVCVPLVQFIRHKEILVTKEEFKSINIPFKRTQQTDSVGNYVAHFSSIQLLLIKINGCA
jgi:Zn-dependent M32 family carboxypeptidase